MSENKSLEFVEFFGMSFPLEWFAVNPLNYSAFLYLFSCLAYFIAVARSGAKSQSVWTRIGGWSFGLAFVLHTLGLLGRWYVGGLDRPPWTNLYESLIGFAWGLSVFHLLAIRRWKIPLVGAFAVPLVFLLMGMSVMTANKSVEPLIPALQSNWLKIHVVFGIISYAGFTMAACMAFLQLVKSHTSLSKIGIGVCLMLLMNLGIAGGKDIFYDGKFYMAKTVERELPDGKKVMVKDTYQESPGGAIVTRMEEIPGGNVFFFLSVVMFVISSLAFYFFRNKSKKKGNDVGRQGFVAYVIGMLMMLGLFATIFVAKYQSATLTFQSNPYLTMLLIMSFFTAMTFFFVMLRYEQFNAQLPSAERLDEISYKNILFAFPFQTLLLITGAVWAYYAWGRSWGWDPKETWALITWLAYLLYLHGKLLLNWKPAFLSVIALIGFALMVFAFLGVNLVLSGLHSYGAA
jgi:cytochrome c-type biogenesis protein CcsB